TSGRRLLIFCGVAILVSSGVASSTSAQGRGQGAQAVATPAEPTPRWPDGRINLGSTPEKKGYWENRPGLGGTPRAADIPMQPWARALSEYRSSRVDMYPPLVHS